jgi:hypothetical protein
MTNDQIPMTNGILEQGAGVFGLALRSSYSPIGHSAVAGGSSSIRQQYQVATEE